MTKFYNSNGDTGASEAAAIQPITTADAVLPENTNRPTENLRLRTEQLAYDVENQALINSSPLLIAALSGGSATAVHWDGVYDPVAGAPPNANTLGSGIMWAGGSPGSGATYRIQLASAPAADVAATATVNYANGISLRFRADLKAYAGSNSLRVRLFSDSSNELGVGQSTLVTWTHASVDMLTQPAASAGTYPLVAPDPLQARPTTLNIQVRSDGTTTIGQVQTAIAASYPYAFTTLDGISRSANTDSPIVIDILSSAHTTSTTLPAVIANGSVSTGYVQLSGGLDRAYWTLSDATLAAFFDVGLVNTTLSSSVSGAGTATVQVASATNIAVGSKLAVGSNATYEQVTVTAVNPGASPPTFTATFAMAHASGSPVGARPNAVRAGDSVVVRLGKGRAWLSSPTNITQSQIFNTRNGGVDQDDFVIPLIVAPDSINRAFVYGAFGVDAGTSYTGIGGSIAVAGDLTGPGSTASVPRVVRASGSSPGLIQLAGDLAGPASSYVLPTVVRASNAAPGVVQLAGDFAGPSSTATVPRVVRATAGVEGVLRLAGDLAGPSSTATAPTVVRAASGVEGVLRLAGDLAGPGSTATTPRVVQANSVTAGTVQLAGDLAGPASTASAPTVIRASGSAPGTIQLAGDLAGPGSIATAPTVVRASASNAGVVSLNATTDSTPIVPAINETTGLTIGQGISRDGLGTSGTVSVGTGTADTAVSIGKSGAATNVLGTLSTAGTTNLGGDANVSGYINGVLGAGTTQRAGSANYALVKGYQTGLAAHGDVITFPVAYPTTPNIVLSGGYIHEPRSKWGATGSGSETTAFNSAAGPILEDFAALSATSTGFTVRARLRQSVTTSTARTVDRSSATAVTQANYQTPTTSNTLVATNGASFDNTYTFTWSGSLFVSASPRSGGSPLNPVQVSSTTSASIDVVLEVQLTSGGSWTAVKTYPTVNASVTSTSSATRTNTVALGESVGLYLAGVTSQTSWRLRVASYSYTAQSDLNDVEAGSASFSLVFSSPAVSYTTTSGGDQYASKTSDPGVKVKWEAWI